MKLNREEALEILDGERGKLVSDKIIGHSRWSVQHEIIVLLDEKHYQSFYSVGATESQDESPWEYEKEVEFTEVEPKEVMVTKYIPVKVKEAV